jgi:hypothetical protein
VPTGVEVAKTAIDEPSKALMSLKILHLVIRLLI